MTIAEDGIPGWERAELARAIHACESPALIAFYTHFRPILTERAQLFGIPQTECRDAVETFLGDMLLSLASGRQLPRRLHGYVLVSFRRFAARSGKASRLEAGVLGEYGETLGHAVQPAQVAESMVAYGHSARSDADASTLETGETADSGHQIHPALARFAERLLAGLGSEDRFLLGAKAEEMPLREIAALLDLNYNAANTRLFRLRAQLRKSAGDVLSRMNVADRPIVERFLRRSVAPHGKSPECATESADKAAQERRLSNG
jgi:hypothetical protein